MLVGFRNNRYISYVGYTKNLSKRLNLHNDSRGAKFTRGTKWKMVYKEMHNSKSKALKAEHKLKKNYVLRKKIKIKYLNG
tara:strand:- start:231 stop:470 length:240 start_codon:yes stop_codon:yes gene_type:complete